MRRLALVALVLVALPSAGAARPTGGTPVAIVAEAGQPPPPFASNNLLLAGLGGRIVVYDASASTAVLGTIAVPRGPQDVASTFDAGRVLVASPAAGAVTLLDARRYVVLKVFRGISNPADVAISTDGRRGYVVEKGRGRLLVLDLVLLRVAGRVAVGARPNRLDVSDNLAWVWVAHEAAERALTVVDVARLARPRVMGRLAWPGRSGRSCTSRTAPGCSHLPALAVRGQAGRRPPPDGLPGPARRHRHGARRRLDLDPRLGSPQRRRIAVLSSRTGTVLNTMRAGGPVSETRSYGSFMAVRTPHALRIVVATTGRLDHTIPVRRGVAGFDVAVI